MNDGASLAVAGHGHEKNIVAVRAGRPITHAEFSRDVAALAARLPAHKYMLNLCTDRYRFMVGFLAALKRQQISLLPPSTALGVLNAIVADYPDLYALTDSAEPPFAGMIYPGDLDAGAIASDIMAMPDEQAALILFTSGSTGQPKPVPKSWGPLARSALAAGDRLGISRLAGATVIGTVPHQHSYGLESMIFLGLQHGLIIDAGWPLYPADIRAAIERALGPRILVTTPVHLGALVGEPGGMPQCDLILSATAPLSASLAAQAEKCFGARLIEIYGCTEAGQVATRRTVHETQWHCLDGVDLSQNEHCTWANGAAVAGTALLQDAIELSGPSTFLLGERTADLVDVAGKRASLAALNQVLLGIPGVRDGVFVMGEAISGRVPRLMALVVAPGLTKATLLRELRQRLDLAFLPRPLVFVEALPRNDLGKLPRAELLALARKDKFA
jgi:acyl-coenzyme A synthetase/AMP-(fatty) acid ligase